MDNNIVVVKKKNTFWTVVKILLIVGAVALVAAKIYQKFFKNRKPAVCEAEADEEAPVIDVAQEETEAEAFEVSADAVIANTADMEEVAEN